MSQKVKLNLQMPEEMNSAISEIAREGGGSKSDVMRQALALICVAYLAKKSGQHLGFVDDPNKLDVEIIGLL